MRHAPDAGSALQLQLQQYEVLLLSVSVCLLCALCRRRLNYAQSVNQEIVVADAERRTRTTGTLMCCLYPVENEEHE